MQSTATMNKTVQLETLPPAILNYIKDLESGYNQRLNELEKNYKTLQFEHEVLKEKYDIAMYRRFARSAEQLLRDKTQPLLFASEEIKTEKASGTVQYEFEEIKSYCRKKTGRKPLDPKLPRVEKIIDIEASEKTCGCGSKLTKIGEESNEKLHIIPPRIYVEKTIRPKYACRHCEGTEDEGRKTVRIAPVEPAIIPRGIASPSLLSTIITQKFEDHLPYYRQEKQFERIMVTISRQDMSNWQQQVYSKVKPLFVLMKEALRAGPVIRMDETTTQVMGEEGRSDTKKSYIWLSMGGPPDKTVSIYQYRQTRAGAHAKEILEGYRGFLQTDGYSGYDSALEGNSAVIHVGCFAHARRKFFEASKVKARAETAEKGVGFIKRLYTIEMELRKKYTEDEKDDEAEISKQREKFNIERKKQVLPILNEFKQWLLKLKDDVPPSSLLGTAVGYSLSQWDKLVRYLENPYLTPDNNICENGIRPFVIGRKNWLFSKSPEGADSSCGMYSLIQTAKQNGLEPFNYLKTLFEQAPYAQTVEDWDKLLPWNIFKS